MPSIHRLDYDFEYGRENIKKVVENIRFAEEILSMPVKRITFYRSYSGNIHAYVEFVREYKPHELIMFEYFSFSDRRRIFPNLRRAYTGYPGRFNYLFSHYYHKPDRRELCTNSEIDIYILAITVRYLSLY